MTGGKLDCRLIVDKDYETYDNFIDTSYNGTIFHKTWWLNTICECEKTYKVDYYGLFRDENLVSVFPVTYINKFNYKLIINPKITPYSGPVYSNENLDKRSTIISKSKEINTACVEILKKYNVCLNYIFNLHLKDVQPYKWFNFNTNIHYTYILTLEDIEKIWNDMDRKRRNEIKTYNKNSSDNEMRYGDIDAFIHLNNKTMERQNHFKISDKLWTNIYKESKIRDNCEIFTSYKDGVPVASLFLVWDNFSSYYIGGGINNNSEGAMSSLIWEAIKYSKLKLNRFRFDFEGSSVPSIEQYFRKFGGDLIPYFSVRSKNSELYFAINKLKNKIINQ